MNLALERKRKGLTQAALAAVSGVSLKVIADIERGKTEGAASTLRQLQRGLEKAVVGSAEAMEMFPPVAKVDPESRLSDAALCAQVRAQREAEGMGVVALAKLMRVKPAEVEALEDGDTTLLVRAWAALDDWTEKRWQSHQDTKLAAAGPCGWCGKVHGVGKGCPP